MHLLHARVAPPCATLAPPQQSPHCTAAGWCAPGAQHWVLQIWLQIYERARTVSTTRPLTAEGRVPLSTCGVTLRVIACWDELVTHLHHPQAQGPHLPKALRGIGCRTIAGANCQPHPSVAPWQRCALSAACGWACCAAGCSPSWPAGPAQHGSELGSAAVHDLRTVQT